jgi:hypothetical protein
VCHPPKVESKEEYKVWRLKLSYWVLERGQQLRKIKTSGNSSERSLRLSPEDLFSSHP